MNAFSTNQVAKRLGIATKTLSRYIAQGKVPAPHITEVGGSTIHSWTEEEVEKLRQLLPKIANGRRTRYKKRQSALSSQQSAKTKAQARAPQPRQAKRLSGTPKPVPHKKNKPKKK